MPTDHGFDYRWQRHPRPQPPSDAFWTKTGWQPSDLEGKVVLDAGCGCGRFSAMAAGCGAKVYGIDGSEAAVAAAKQNCPTGTFWVQNLLHTIDLPAKPDLVFSIGVLHHTADPALAFRNVAATLGTGGRLAVWLYAKPMDDGLEPVARFLHDITRACPPEKLYEACANHSVAVRDLYREMGVWGHLQQILGVSMSKDDEECVSDTFDWHCPQYRSWHTVDEVCGWFRDAGFAVDRIGNFPVSIRGVKQ